MTAQRVASTLGWGIYCACSWTWCIGMYLPIILLDRFGLPGVIAFAIPNVIGCTAFGYVLKSAAASRALISRNCVLMQWFSRVTIAFHVFFAGMIAQIVLSNGAVGTEVPVVASVSSGVCLLGCGWLVSHLPTRFWPLIAIAVYAISISCLSRLASHVSLTDFDMSGSLESIKLLWVLPVFVFGFLLCPYFDLTFHRALQASGNRHVFSVFGMTFAIMIVLTCAYSTVLFDGSGSIYYLVLAHLSAQAVFTIAAHLRELRASKVEQPSNTLDRMLHGLPYAVGLLSLPAALDDQLYLRWLVFYGLVYPALAIRFLGEDTEYRRSKSRHIALCIILLALAPLYEAGFIYGHTQVLIVPAALGIVWLFVRTVRFMRRQNPTARAAEAAR